VQDHQPVVARPPVIVSHVFEMLEKPKDAIERQRVKGDLRQSTSRIRCDEGEKEPQRIAIGFNRRRPEAFLKRELVGEERVK
jgi:hypothetical protein